MPSAMHNGLAAPPCKKRRRDDDGDMTALRKPLHEVDYMMPTLALLPPGYPLHSPFHESDIYSEPGQKPSITPATRKTSATRTPSKRQRVLLSDHDETRSHSTLPATTRTGRSPSHTRELQETDVNNRNSLSCSFMIAKLSRCHICHRKPIKKADLADFADCQGCGQRTCYVCIRQCGGWYPADYTMTKPETTEGMDLSASITMDDASRDLENSNTKLDGSRDGEPERAGRQLRKGWGGGKHRDRICSGCCVERGPDGDVVCFGCLAFVES